jgi:hypothetical protein
MLNKNEHGNKVSSELFTCIEVVTTYQGITVIGLMELKLGLNAAG